MACRSGTKVDFVGAWFDPVFLDTEQFVEKIKLHSKMSGTLATDWQRVGKVENFLGAGRKWGCGHPDVHLFDGSLDLLGCNCIFASLDKHQRTAPACYPEKVYARTLARPKLAIKGSILV